MLILDHKANSNLENIYRRNYFKTSIMFSLSYSLLHLFSHPNFKN